MESLVDGRRKKNLLLKTLRKIQKSPAFMKEKILVVIFTLMVIWVQGSLLFPNGIFDNQGNLIFDDYGAFRDIHRPSVFNWRAFKSFPPTNFAAGGIALKNYHYFFDVSVAVLAKILPISLLTLYFRVVPIIFRYC